MDYIEIEQRFNDALEQAGLLKMAESEEVTSLEQEDEDTTEQEEIVGEVPEKVKGDRSVPKSSMNIFEHPMAHPYVLDLALLKKYGPDWFEWEPETIELRVPHDFDTPRISDLNMEKLQAVKTLHYVDGYWKRWQVFVVCTMPLNSMFPDFDVMSIPTAAQCAVSVDIASRIRGDVPWSEELKKYVGTVCRFDGVLCPPTPLEFAHIDTDDLPIDCAIIHEQWPTVRRTGKAPQEETVEAEQLRRMLLVHEMVQEDRERLRQQLPLLLHE